MQAIAYGVTMRKNRGTCSELITADIMYIKTVDIPETDAMDKIISYHRKCVAFAINSAFVSPQLQVYNTKVERTLLSGISIAYANQQSVSLYIRSAIVDNKTYLRHQFTPLNSGYLFNLYQEL